MGKRKFASGRHGAAKRGKTLQQTGKKLVQGNVLPASVQESRPPKEDSAAGDSTKREAIERKGFKRTYAIVFGYLGKDYYGMQKQLNSEGLELQRTVEGELEKALHAVGGISHANFGVLQKVGWSRVGRTDKGVHAACQVVALKLTLPLVQHEDHQVVKEGQTVGNFDSHDVDVTYAPLLRHNKALAQVENDFLVALQEECIRRATGIRIHGLFPVSKKFDARTQCSRREYEYLLPLRFLRPVRFSRTGSPETGSSRNATFAATIGPALATTDAASALHIKDAADFFFTLSENERRKRMEDLFHQASPNSLLTEQLNSSNSVHCGRLWAADDTSTVNEEESGQLLQKAQDLFNQYCGNRKFHNFTSRVTPGDASLWRFVDRCTVDVVTLGNEKFLRLVIVGQSFLLNQIRKMVGLVVEIMKGTAPKWAASDALNKQNKRFVHMAPAEGLFLSRAHYDAYNAKREADSSTLDYSKNPLTECVGSTPSQRAMELTEGAVSDRIEEFKSTVIYPTIAADLRKDEYSLWRNWLELSVLDHPYFVVNWPPKLLLVTKSPATGLSGSTLDSVRQSGVA